MVGLLMLKSLGNLSDELVVIQWKRNEYSFTWKSCLENTVNIVTIVPKKNITYPTDAKLAIKIINRLNKLAKHFGIQQRRTFVKEEKNLRLDLRYFRNVNKRRKVKRALQRLRTIANVLVRDLNRRLLAKALTECRKDFSIYEKM